MRPATQRNAALVVILAMTTAPAIAQDTARQALRQACINDVRALCSGIFPGGGRIKKCMTEKFDQLSDGCKGALKQAQAAGK